MNGIEVIAKASWSLSNDMMELRVNCVDQAVLAMYSERQRI